MSKTETYAGKLIGGYQDEQIGVGEGSRNAAEVDRKPTQLDHVESRINEANGRLSDFCRRLNSMREKLTGIVPEAETDANKMPEPDALMDKINLSQEWQFTVLGMIQAEIDRLEEII